MNGAVFLSSGKGRGVPELVLHILVIRTLKLDKSHESQ